MMMDRIVLITMQLIACVQDGVPPISMPIRCGGQGGDQHVSGGITKFHFPFFSGDHQIVRVQEGVPPISMPIRYGG